MLVETNPEHLPNNLNDFLKDRKIKNYELDF